MYPRVLALDSDLPAACKSVSQTPRQPRGHWFQTRWDHQNCWPVRGRGRSWFLADRLRRMALYTSAAGTARSRAIRPRAAAILSNSTEVRHRWRKLTPQITLVN